MYPQCITAPWDAPVFLFDTENIDWRVQLDAEKRMFMQITNSRKKQHHTISKLVTRENNYFYQLIGSSWPIFPVTLQTTTKNPLSFLITFLSSSCLFSYIWISTCCVLFSELFLRWDNQWHFRSANNNFTFQLNLSLLHAFLPNFKNWFAYCEQNERELNGKLWQNFGLVQPLLINSCASVIVVVANDMAVLQIRHLLRV